MIVMHLISDKCDFLIKPITAFAWRVYAPLDRTEKLFMKMTNIFTMVNQVGIERCRFIMKKYSSMLRLQLALILIYCFMRKGSDKFSI
jgi:hypothetical protein